MVEILAATPAVLAGLIEAVGPARGITPPAPGKWSAAEIVSHLADCELVFGFRLRQTAAEDNYVIQPFDQRNGQRSMAKFRQPGPGYVCGAAGLEPAVAADSVAGSGRADGHAPERGTMTFQTIVETMAGHDLNHIGQLQRIAAARI